MEKFTLKRELSVSFNGLKTRSLSTVENEVHYDFKLPKEIQKKCTKQIPNLKKIQKRKETSKEKKDAEESDREKETEKFIFDYGNVLYYSGTKCSNKRIQNDFFSFSKANLKTI